MKTKDLAQHLKSIRDIESRSRLNFLSKMADDAEYAIETAKQSDLWSKPTDSKCKALSWLNCNLDPINHCFIVI